MEEGGGGGRCRPRFSVWAWVEGGVGGEEIRQVMEGEEMGGEDERRGNREERREVMRGEGRQWEEWSMAWQEREDIKEVHTKDVTHGIFA